MGEEAPFDTRLALAVGGDGDAAAKTTDADGTGTRKKLRLTKEQWDFLDNRYRENSSLTPMQKPELADLLNLRPRQVEVWFQNRRARTKLKQKELDCEFLKKCCESLTEENRQLKEELQELRSVNSRQRLSCDSPRQRH
ncbi:unnamed protein product [Spirodela intermedia]|uniref:Homeobox domain-containing protein n=1 Tax=Spirodela intermedia TaxID=51605 RepID=A0A7I8JLJ9_SPIIN|nr:unnamed protein product [Spirodela intermedia]CAA6670342.1 unnamed protein product [Spirodela intermedia]